MHKKLASDLTSLAHSILQMKNKEDVLALKQKAHEVYEKLALLAYVDEYLTTTPNADVSKEELIEKITSAEKNQTLISLERTAKLEAEPITEIVTENNNLPIEDNLLEEAANDISEQVIEDVAEEIISEDKIEQTTEEVIEQPFDELENLLFGDPEIKDEATFIEETKSPSTPTLEDELKDTLSVDVMADLFQKVETPKTINDKLQNTIQIGLNDRIAFVKNLFDGNQEDFNRVISQLNTFDNEKDAKKFISKMVKPDYDWSSKEEYETRLLDYIERRFA
ncbi:hypothetical protein [Tenacibaculum geojense]|uniref:Uncharacterized protein n=1 Tax=Tenacibaculum geojense TaxID=915352 RepID=A0ABW3JU32_9FLAO